MESLGIKVGTGPSERLAAVASSCARSASLFVLRNPSMPHCTLQAGLTDLPTVHPFGDIVANTAALADAFRAKGLPVVLVGVAGTAPGRTERGDAARDLPDGFTEVKSHVVVRVPSLP